MEKQTIKYIVAFIIGFALVYGFASLRSHNDVSENVSNLPDFIKDNIVSTSTKNVAIKTSDEKQGTTVVIDSNGGKYNVELVGSVPIGKQPDLSRRPIIGNATDEQVKTILNKKFDDAVVNLNKDLKNATNWVVLGNVYKMANDYVGARDCYEYAKSLSPSDLVAYNNLGDLYHYYLKDYTNAENNLKNVILIDPNYIVGYRNLSDLYTLTLKDDVKAKNVLELGLSKNPNSVDLLTLLALNAVKIGDIQKAGEYFDRAIAEAKKIGNDRLVSTLTAQKADSIKAN